VKVESRLTESDPDALTPGMEMELVVVPFRIDDDGNEVVTFAFRPVGGGGDEWTTSQSSGSGCTRSAASRE
jgi:hypothetical protein